MSTGKICCIIDLDGFYVNGRFLARELGWISYPSGQSGSIRFDLRPYRNSMGWQDRQENERITNEISGLTFDPRPEESTVSLETLESHILQIYRQFCSGARNVVAFKGGNHEKDILRRQSIPFLNIEELGCPKYDEIRHLSVGQSCGYHIANLHCPLAEVIAFKNWLRNRYG